MEIKTLVLGDLGTNCYILEDSDQRVCAVIDPADSADAIIRATEKRGVKIEKIILTHAHFDHMLALPELFEKTGAQVLVGQYDAPGLSLPMLNLSQSFMGTFFSFSGQYATIREGDVITIGENIRLQVLETPGHTPGSLCFLAQDDGCIFTGDTVFAGSIGRTDFPGGNFEAIMSSLSRVLALDGALRIYPGHGASSLVCDERACNPYFRR